MIQRKLRRPVAEKKVGLNLRLDETELGFLHEVKEKRGCSIASYIRFLLHRYTYENSKPKQDVKGGISLLMKDKKLTETFRLHLTKSESEELERIKLESGVSKNSFIRWLIRRRLTEYSMLGGELFEIV